MQEKIMQRKSMPVHGKLANVSDPDLVRTWRAFLERYHTATCALERVLKQEHQLGMSEFEVLDRLAEWEKAESCQGAGRRAQDLATSLHLSQSALSRVIARLEDDGLVTRGMCPNDRRGIYVHLTDDGRSKHAQALPTQRQVLAAQLPVEPASSVLASSPARVPPQARVQVPVARRATGRRSPSSSSPAAKPRTRSR
jgi:DNA-binding MarR family transcriptional regulator